MCWAFTVEYIKAVKLFTYSQHYFSQFLMTVMKDNLAKSYLEHVKPDLCRDKDDNTTELYEDKSSVTPSVIGNVSM